MKSRSSSAPGAPGFILPASSLPCASADFRRVWGGGRGKTLRYSLCRGEVETRTARGAALPASIRAALAANQKSHFFPRGKKKNNQAPSEVTCGLCPGSFPAGGDGEGNPSPERFWVSRDRFLPSCGDDRRVRPRTTPGRGALVPPPSPQSPHHPDHLPTKFHLLNCHYLHLGSKAFPEAQEKETRGGVGICLLTQLQPPPQIPPPLSSLALQ